MGSTVKLKPTAINESGKKLPIQFAELNGSSICNLLNLVWSQPVRLEFSWKHACRAKLSLVPSALSDGILR